MESIKTDEGMRSFDLESLAWLILTEEDNEEDVARSIRTIQLNYSRLYILLMELIAEGKAKMSDVPAGFKERLPFVGNHLTFLDNLAYAFEEVKEIPE